MTTKEMIEVMQAYERGEQIEWKSRVGFDWSECGDVPLWDWSCVEYRVKPQPTCRPYKNAAEFLAAQKEHGIYVSHEDFPHWYQMPMFVTDKEITLTEVHNDERVYARGITLFRLFREFKWQDGTPCGVEE